MNTLLPAPGTMALRSGGVTRPVQFAKQLWNTRALVVLTAFGRNPAAVVTELQLRNVCVKELCVTLVTPLNTGTFVRFVQPSNVL